MNKQFNSVKYIEHTLTHCFMWHTLTYFV